MNQETKRISDLTMAGLIAALYVLLTFLANLFGLASGAVQLRLSEALTIMPLVTWAAVPGLFVGCVLANFLTGCALWDVVFGSLATLAGALGTYYIGRKYPVMAPVFPIIANCLVVPLVLQYVYGSADSYWFLVGTVGLGEILSCGVLGGLLYKVLKKRKLFHEIAGQEK